MARRARGTRTVNGAHSDVNDSRGSCWRLPLAASALAWWPVPVRAATLGRTAAIPAGYAGRMPYQPATWPGCRVIRARRREVRNTSPSAATAGSTPRWRAAKILRMAPDSSAGVFAPHRRARGSLQAFDAGGHTVVAANADAARGLLRGSRRSTQSAMLVRPVRRRKPIRYADAVVVAPAWADLLQRRRPAPSARRPCRRPSRRRACAARAVGDQGASWCTTPSGGMNFGSSRADCRSPTAWRCLPGTSAGCSSPRTGRYRIWKIAADARPPF